MIFVESLIKILNKNKINFFTGVPDSVLKNLSHYLDKLPKNNHIIASNEGSAASIGIGYYLSKKKIPCVYLQNSGLSNAVNPLISIANKQVYSIPLLLIIGWRGSPKIQDEPQHQAKGKITIDLLKLLKIKYCILREEKDLKKLNKILKFANKKNQIVACLVEKKTLNLKKNIKKIKIEKNSHILRSYFIREFLKIIPSKSKIISTTGYTSRELMQIRRQDGIKKGKDFYMVGGMGHSSSVAAGVALFSKPDIFCLDGDGSVLMHLGPLRTVGYLNKKNFKHIILNNNSHESVGGQVTNAFGIDFKKLSYSLGYKNFFQIKNKKQVKIVLKNFIKIKGPNLLEVRIKQGSIKNLLRPKSLITIKKNFMKN